MYAVEFETTLKDGLIKIPSQYVSQLQAHCRVIILQEEPVHKIQVNASKKEQFLAKVARHRFDLPNDYTFNREELYERQ